MNKIRNFCDFCNFSKIVTLSFNFLTDTLTLNKKIVFTIKLKVVEFAKSKNLLKIIIFLMTVLYGYESICLR